MSIHKYIYISIFILQTVRCFNYNLYEGAVDYNYSNFFQSDSAEILSRAANLKAINLAEGRRPSG